MLNVSGEYRFPSKSWIARTQTLYSVSRWSYTRDLSFKNNYFIVAVGPHQVLDHWEKIFSLTKAWQLLLPAVLTKWLLLASLSWQHNQLSTWAIISKLLTRKEATLLCIPVIRHRNEGTSQKRRVKYQHDTLDER